VQQLLREAHLKDVCIELNFYMRYEVLGAVNIMVMVFWNVIYNLVEGFCQNFGSYLPDYTASHPEDGTLCSLYLTLFGDLNPVSAIRGC
jgi:hypothetical protein